MQIYNQNKDISAKDIVLNNKPEYINEYNYLKFKISVEDGGPKLTK